MPIGARRARVEQTPGGALPAVTSLNRSDDDGAETMDAYLRGALACTDAGGREMKRLSSADGRSLASIMLRLCAGRERRAEQVVAEVAQEDLDPRGRSLWRIRKTGALTEDVLVWVRQVDGNWAIDERCTGCGHRP